VINTAVIIGRDPTTHPIPPHLDSYMRALLASRDRRHLFMTLWVRWFTDKCNYRFVMQWLLQYPLSISSRSWTTVYANVPKHCWTKKRGGIGPLPEGRQEGSQGKPEWLDLQPLESRTRHAKPNQPSCHSLQVMSIRVTYSICYIQLGFYDRKYGMMTFLVFCSTCYLFYES
jgi:hypothetical protein